MVKRTALPVRLVVAFNKVEIKVIAKKMLSNYTFVTSKYNRGAAARRGGAPRAPGSPLLLKILQIYLTNLR